MLPAYSQVAGVITIDLVTRSVSADFVFVIRASLLSQLASSAPRTETVDSPSRQSKSLTAFDND